jgi:competence protein ComEC
VMVALLKSSQFLRAPSNPLSALTACALAVLIIQPRQLFGASFQLSYGIVAALLLLGLPLAGAWQAKWSPFRDLPPATWRWWQHLVAWAWHGLSAAIAIGAASSLVGTLGGIMFFKLFTPGALLVNLVLIPIASLVILGGFMSLVAGLLGVATASVLFNHAAVLVLWMIDGLVRVFLVLPAMWFEAVFVHTWIGPAALATLLLLLIAGYQTGWSARRIAFWIPFAFVALVLVCAVRFQA